MWSYLFGKNGNSGSSKSKELPKKAIIELREHINLLNKKQTHLQSQILQNENDAKKFLLQNNKTLAKNSLKRKKVYEQQLDKLQGQIDSLEQQLFSIESANLNLETMRAMKQGARAMKSIHNGIDIDKVDETMDEIREQVELSEEISDAISKPLYTAGSLANEVDEDELDEELELLQQEQINSNIVNTTTNSEIAVPSTVKQKNANISLPNAPQNKLNENIANDKINEEESEDEDERALRELQAEMGL